MILTDLYLTHHHEVNSEAPPDLESSRHSEIAGEICIVHRNHMKPLLNSLPKAPRPQGRTLWQASALPVLVSRLSSSAKFNNCSSPVQAEFGCVEYRFPELLIKSLSFFMRLSRDCLCQSLLRQALGDQTQCLFRWQMF